MKKLLYKLLNKFCTKNYTRIPLLWVHFDYKYYKKYGLKNSCWLNTHPVLRKDQYIIDTMNSLVDYIRQNYSMEDIRRKT